MPLIMSPVSPAPLTTTPQAALATGPATALPPSPSQSISVPLPHIVHNTLHIQLTRFETSNLVFLTTSDPYSSSFTSPLGSFVYAMPNVPFRFPTAIVVLQLTQMYSSFCQRFQSTEPLCTHLYAMTETIDFATRVAKIIARRTEKPAYVGCSAVFPAADVEEETGALRMAVQGVMGLLEKEG